MDIKAIIHRTSTIISIILLILAIIIGYNIFLDDNSKTPQIVQPELTIDNVIDNLDRTNIIKVEYSKSAKFNDMRMISITFKNRVNTDSAEGVITKQIYQSYQFNNYFNLANNAYAYLYSNNRGQELFLMRDRNRIMIIIGNNFGAELTKLIQTFPR